MNFATALQNVNNVTETENGAVAFKSTKSYLLDFFAGAGALRLGKTIAQAELMFAKAYAEDKNLALKALFYIRDVRGGQGEREVFRKCFAWVSKNYPSDVKHLVSKISEFGRWDDLFALLDTPLQADVIEVIAGQLATDMRVDAPSILAKWMKSENTSSKASKGIARKVRMALKLDSKTYRKMLSSLRSKINVVEKLMSANKWSDITYSHVPSNAGKRYKTAFRSHDASRYETFMTKVESGEVKLNVKTLYPYEIIKDTNIFPWGGNGVDWQYLQNAWNSLPDYFEGAQADMLVVADTSGSMNGDPIHAAVSLAMYAAKHNKGAWHGKFMTFSEQPTFIELKDSMNLETQIRVVGSAPWGMNTNIAKVFEQVLQAGKSCGTVVSRIVIVSDMQFDQCARTDQSVFSQYTAKFNAAGFELPKITFWNVAARSTQFQATENEVGVQLVSGLSPSLFKSIVANDFPHPYDFMLSVINAPRYESIGAAV